MLIKVNGLVTRCIKYAESSLIFDLYTKDFGRVSMIIGGVRKKRTRIPASIFQLMNWIEVVVYLKDPKTLNRVKEARPIVHYKDLPFNLRKRSIGLFMTEVIQKTIREHEPNHALFQFLHDTYLFLDRSEQPVENLHLVFLLQLTQYLGFLPHGVYSEEKPYLDLLKGSFESQQHPVYTLDKGASKLLSDLNQHVAATCHHLLITREQRQNLIQSLITFYKLHLDKMPEIQTHAILADVL